jgi:outer membrane protein assembly factor BamB
MDDLIFVGFNSQVVALDRETGDIVWEWRSRQGSGYVTVLLDGDRLVVSVIGYTYCLDSATGRELWFNPLKGMGVGVVSMASARGGISVLLTQAAAQAAEEDEERRRQSTAATQT